jgi:hypothetical protein
MAFAFPEPELETESVWIGTAAVLIWKGLGQKYEIRDPPRLSNIVYLTSFTTIDGKTVQFIRGEGTGTGLFFY